MLKVRVYHYLSVMMTDLIILFTKISLATSPILSNQPKLMKRVKPDITTCPIERVSEIRQNVGMHR